MRQNACIKGDNCFVRSSASLAQFSYPLTADFLSRLISEVREHVKSIRANLGRVGDQQFAR